MDRIAQRGEDAVHMVLLDDERRAEGHDIGRHPHQEAVIEAPVESKLVTPFTKHT